MKKVLYIATVVKTHIMEFHIPYLKMFKEMGWDTSVAAKNDYENPKDCKIDYCDHFYDINFSRSPISIKNFKAFKELKKIIDEGDYDIIHCHTPIAAALTRIAAKKARKRGSKVYYTAHGFHFYKGAPILNWIIYYPIEKYLAHLTDTIITINKEDYSRAKTFKSTKVVYMPGVGINSKKFNCPLKDKSILREKLGIPHDKLVLLSVGEVNKNKNHEVVIKSLPLLPNCIYIICGKGPLTEKYRRLAKKLNVSDRLLMTGYRNDVELFYRIADVFVFPSFREGLPVAVMEAMASGLPVVATSIRGNNDLIKEGENGILVYDPRSAQEFANAISKAKNMKTDSLQTKKYDISEALETIKDVYFN